MPRQHYSQHMLQRAYRGVSISIEGCCLVRDADEDNPGLSQDGDILRISQDTEIWRGCILSAWDTVLISSYTCIYRQSRLPPYVVYRHTTI